MVMLSRCLSLVVLATPAAATYSIVGADSAASLAGISITSCVGNLELDIAVGFAHGPIGFGVVAAQAYVDFQFRGRDLAVEQMSAGVAADAVVAAITKHAVDPGFNDRQYGIAETGSLSDGSSSLDWTGASTFAWSGGTSGFSMTDRMPFSAQGNILTGPGCVSQSAAGFREESSARTGRVRRASSKSAAGFLAAGIEATTAQREEECFDLPARLMRALLRGADNGEGDSRCTEKNPSVPADSAYIRVDLPSGEPWLLLSAPGTYPRSAPEVLYEKYLRWRSENPCEGGAGLAAFRANATALRAAKEEARRHSKMAEAVYLKHVAARGNSSVLVI